MLEERIYQDYIQAFKARNKVKTEFLSVIRAEFKNEAINAKQEKLDDDQALAVLNKQKKRLEETRESISASGRLEAIEQTKQELEIISSYLPQPLTDEETAEVVAAVISETGAASMKDMGRVMKEVIARVGVRADAKKVSGLVKQTLSPSA